MSGISRERIEFVRLPSDPSELTKVQVLRALGCKQEAILLEMVEIRDKLKLLIVRMELDLERLGDNRNRNDVIDAYLKPSETSGISADLENC